MTDVTREVNTAEVLEVAPEAADGTNNTNFIDKARARATELVGWQSQHMGSVVVALTRLCDKLGEAGSDRDRYRWSLIAQVIEPMHLLRIELVLLIEKQKLRGENLPARAERLRGLRTTLCRRHCSTGLLEVNGEEVAVMLQWLDKLVKALRRALHQKAAKIIQSLVEMESRPEDGSDSTETGSDSRERKKRGRRRANECGFGVVCEGGYWTADEGNDRRRRLHIKASNGRRAVPVGNETANGHSIGTSGVNGSGSSGKKVVSLPVLACGATTCNGCALSGMCSHQPDATGDKIDAYAEFDSERDFPSLSPEGQDHVD